MAIPKDFEFPVVIPAIESEFNRRAVLMFGKQWRQRCSCAFSNDESAFAIAVGSKELRIADSRRDSSVVVIQNPNLWTAVISCSENGVMHDGIIGGRPSRIEYDYREGSPDFDEEPAILIRSRTYHHTNDVCADSADGSPAMVQYGNDGRRQVETHYINGHIQDPADGAPARVYYYPNGNLKRTDHFRAGQLTGPKDGSPSVICYSERGKVNTVEHYTNDELSDLPDGTPARIFYAENGEVLGGASSKNGELTAAKTIEMLHDAQLRRVKEILDNAAPTIVPVGMPLPADMTLQDEEPQSRLFFENIRDTVATLRSAFGK